MIDKPNILGMQVLEFEDMPPGRIALVDMVGILRRAPRDAKGRLIISAGICKGRIVYLSLEPSDSDTEVPK